MNISGSTGTALNITLDGYQTEKFFINKKVLLGDLYLWKGEYKKAATYYKEVMDISSLSTSLDNRNQYYKIGWNTSDETTNNPPSPSLFQTISARVLPCHRHIGIRRRALLQPVPLTASNITDSISQVEDGHLNEQALETAFGGTRWPDLLRVAIRRNEPAFIANKIYNKLMKSGVSAGEAARARDKLMQKDWFLPFRF